MKDTWYDMGFDADMSWMYDWKGKEKKTTREEAINILEEVKELDDSIYQYNTKYLKALDMAIQALEQEPCEDCISRKAVIDSLHSQFADGFDSDRWWNSMSVLYVINKIPPIKPQEPKTGHWIDTGSGQECSECHEIQYGYDNHRFYCGNCGARMEVEQNG